MNLLARWLEKMGLEEYVPVFIREDVTFEILPLLTDSDLRELGLSLGHRRIFLRAAEALARQDEDASDSPRSWGQGERRQLTLLFCDLIGSTQLSTQLDPEDLRDVIGAYRQACAIPIRRYGGFVGRHAGDEVFAYFGYPMAHEDDAERAVRAGLGIIGAMQKLNAVPGRRQEIELAVRIGIATGFVVVGDMVCAGTNEPDAVTGKAPNLAARLQVIAEPNTVVVAHETKQLIGARFEYRPLGEKALKGINRPVPIWQVVAERDESRFAARSSKLTELVGRDDEIELGLSRWRTALHGRGQVLLFRGEAGIGKSRLVATIRDRIVGEHGADSLTMAMWQGSPFHSNTVLYPIIRGLERLAAIGTGDTDLVKREKLHLLLDEFSVDSNAIAFFSDLLAIPPDQLQPSISMGPGEKRNRTLEALLNWFRSMAASRPLLLIFEDLQWLDPTSQVFVERLVSWARTSHVLILMTMRTDLPQTARPHSRQELPTSRWLTAPNTTVHDLTELSEAQSRLLAAAVCQGVELPPSAIDTVLKKSEGNPLFVEELTKGLLETASWQGRPTKNAVDMTDSQVAIPSTLQDALMSRLDQAGPAREIAQHASVIGREFSLALLSAVSNLPEDRVRNGLEVLVRSELVVPSGVLVGHTYVFRHALLRDAAYRTLLRSQCKEMHLRIADVLDVQMGSGPKALHEVIAHHYALGGAPREAIARWKLAADQAFAHSAHTEAANLLEHAINAVGELGNAPDRLCLELDLTVLRAAALRSLHGYGSEVAEQSYLRARDLCIEAGETRTRFNIEWGLLQCNYVKGETTAARQFAKGLFHHSKHHPDRPHIDAFLAQGMVSFQLGDFETARWSFERGAGLGNPLGDQPHFFTHGQNPGTFCTSFLAYTLWFLGYPDRAKELVESNLATARSRAREPTHLHSFVSALTYAVRIHQNRREPLAVKQLAEELITISRRNHYSYYEALALTHLGWARSIQESPEAGIQQMRHGLAAIEKTGTVNTLPGFYARLADLYAQLGHQDKALRSLQRAKRRNCQNVRFWDAEIERVRGKVLARGSAADIQEAERAFASALAIARRQKAQSLELRTAISLGRFLQKLARVDHARDLLQDCLTRFEEGSGALDLSEVRRLLHELQRA